jgi:predicted DNA-binding transcriptional regulator YafY
VNQSEYDKYKIFLRAFCLLRNEERLFRLDRILDVIDDDEN